MFTKSNADKSVVVEFVRQNQGRVVQAADLKSARRLVHNQS